MGWAGTKNGELLRLAQGRFDAFVTVDRNLSFQQNLAAPGGIAIVVLLHPTGLRICSRLLPSSWKDLPACSPGPSPPSLSLIPPSFPPLGARRGRTPQQTLGTYILIDLRPMDSVAPAHDLPVRPLRSRGMQKAREPGERRGDCAAVFQRDGDRIGRNLDPSDSLISRQCQNIPLMRDHQAFRSACCAIRGRRTGTNCSAG